MMKLLTNFENRQSTRSQRVWVLVWLGCGQLFGSLMGLEGDFDKKQKQMDGPVFYHFNIFRSVLLYSVPSIGVFVVVGKMILDDDVCTKI